MGPSQSRGLPPLADMLAASTVAKAIPLWRAPDDERFFRKTAKGPGRGRPYDRLLKR